MFRKTPDAIGEWSLNNVDLCTDRQKRIAHDIWPSLAEGGVMIYSTCTYNRCENEDNVNYIANELGANIVEFDFPESLEIIEVEPGKYRMLPNRTQGEGFFFAILQKTSKPVCDCQRWEESSRVKSYLTFYVVISLVMICRRV